MEPLVYGGRNIESVTNGGVYAAADRQGTWGNDVDDVLRAISPPPVRHLSVAPLMIVVGDLMTCVRFAFACRFRVSQVHMIDKRCLRYQTDTPGVIYQLQAATFVNSSTRRAGKHLGLLLRNEHHFWGGLVAGVAVAIVGTGGAHAFRLAGSAGARTG